MDGGSVRGYPVTQEFGVEFGRNAAGDLPDQDIEQRIDRRLSSNSAAVNKRAAEVLIEACDQYYNSVVKQFQRLSVDASTTASVGLRLINISSVDNSAEAVSPLLSACRYGEVESIRILLMFPELEIKKSEFSKIEMDIFLSKCRDGKHLFHYLLRNPNLLEMAVYRLYSYTTDLFFENEILKELREAVKMTSAQVRRKLGSMFYQIEEHGFISELGSNIQAAIEKISKFQNFKDSIDKYGVLWLENHLRRVEIYSNNDVDIFLGLVREFIQDQGLPLTPMLENTDSMLKRYDQLSDLNIENLNIEKGPIPAIDRLKIAIFIETRVAKVQTVADRYFDDPMISPRKLYVDGNRFAYLVADKKTTLKETDGHNKYIVSAARISLQELSMRIERVVCAIGKKKIEGRARVAKKEYEIARELSHLKGIAKCYKCFVMESNESLLMVEEFHDDITKLEVHQNERELVDSFSGLIEVVYEMHRERMVHGDIKPDNIVYNRNLDGTFKFGLIDFEFSKNMKNGNEEKKESHDVKKRVNDISSYDVHPTPDYTSPELMYRQLNIAKRKFEDFSSCEIWALGIVLFELRYNSGFPLCDEKFSENIKEDGWYAPHLMYRVSLANYKKEHDALIESKWRLLISKANITLRDRIDLIICRMLRFDPKQRATMDEIHEEMQDIKRSFEITQSLEYY